MSATKRRGRPPSRDKLVPVMVRMTRTERALVRAVSAAHGISESAAVRLVMRAVLARVEALGEDKDRVREILAASATAAG